VRQEEQQPCIISAADKLRLFYHHLEPKSDVVCRLSGGHLYAYLE
jgi:hypothetical protein